ncbi:MAG: DNA adenine methylase [Mobilitalea sp.]
MNTASYFDKTIAFPYMGGKNTRMGELIREILPYNITDYHELFGGSGAILLNLNYVKGKRHYNDRDYGVATWFSVMADAEKSKILIDKLVIAEYSMLEFEKASSVYLNGYENACDIDVAYAEYILITQSFNNIRKSFAKEKVTTELYRRRISIQLPKVAERLKGVRVTNNNALDEIKLLTNQANTTVLLDPPYDLKLISSDKLYRCILCEKDQMELLRLIQNAKCRIFICGYRDPVGVNIYDEYLDEAHGWKRICIGSFHKASSGKKNSIGTEWVWYNTSLPDNAKYFVDVDYKEVR